VDSSPESTDSIPEPTGFGLRNEESWKGSRRFEVGIHWIPTSKPLDSDQNPVDSRSEMDISGPEMNASAADIRDLF
jgi:hypothetical protein